MGSQLTRLWDRKLTTWLLSDSRVLSAIRRNVLIAVVTILVLVSSIVIYTRMAPFKSGTTSETSSTYSLLTTSPNSQTTAYSSINQTLLTSTTSGVLSTTNQTTATSSSIDTTFTTYFTYWININYSGSWNLVYWGWSGTLNGSYSCASSIQRFCLMPYNPTLDNVYGNLNGSGDYSHPVVTYGIGYVENNFCANATKLDSSQNNLMLTLTVLNSISNTTTSNPTASACGTYGV